MSNFDTSNKSVRVRFAPSPTGHLHIGGLRTAIFNWLFARHNNGTFLLRIEDTDIERSKPEYTASILESLDWADIRADEPMVIQTHNIAHHKAVIEQLLKAGKAYRCVCTPQDLADRCGSAVGDEFFIKYDEHCRNKQIDDSVASVIRFALPKDIDHISFNDIIRGTVTFPIEQFDDFVIARTDGTPMYNFVVVVDDAAMRITHVIRGEDHISNTPKQIMLYQACGYTVPQFAHLPLILGPSGERLSKRDAATSVGEYKAEGFLPEALINYLVRLGWAHHDQEIFTREELISLFSLDHVSKKGAIFDIQKLQWVNSVYMKSYSAEELLSYITTAIDTHFLKSVSSWKIEQTHQAIVLYQGRTKTIQELIAEVQLLYAGPSSYNQADVVTWLNDAVVAMIPKLIERCDAIDFTNHDDLAQQLKAFAKEQDIKLTQILQPLRIALIGKSDGPGVFDMMKILGKQTCIRRLATLPIVIEKMHDIP